MDSLARRTRELYPEFRTAEFSIGHIAGKSHVGKVFAVFGPGVVVPSLDGLGRATAIRPDGADRPSVPVRIVGADGDRPARQHGLVQAAPRILALSHEASVSPTVYAG
jgi:hypothetical protein